MEPVFFNDQSEFRVWLEKNHQNSDELLVGFYKIGTKRPSMTWPESVDQALCFGWIDGKRNLVDADSYCIRFTKRRVNSIWSTINIKKVEALSANGLMHPAGQAAFEKRKLDKSEVYSYENEPVDFSPEFEAVFRANERAWEYFTSQAPYYQKTMKHLVMNAKQEKTRRSRLNALIEDSQNGKRLEKWSRG